MNIIIFIVVLVVLIIVHEFGHFIVAKKSGIRVDEFGIGFPPKIFGKKYGETEYSINAIPFGGFVKIFGENPEDPSVSSKDGSRALVNKSRLTQAAVMFAGVFFNILLAWVLFSATLMAGTPAISGSTAEDNAGSLSKYISNERLLITHVLPNSPADIVGILSGDEILSLSVVGISDEIKINVNTPDEVILFIKNNNREVLNIELQRGGEIKTVLVSPEEGLIENSPGYFAIGIGMGMIGDLKLPIHLALFEGGKHTIEMLHVITVGIVTFLFDAVLLNADLSTVAGPVGIVGLVGDASALGFIAILNFVGLISINLAVINLIPFPALDGGRILFLVIEAVKGSPIKPHIANVVNMVGFALLIFLMIVITLSDITRLVG